jgi:hypothetical protein
LKFAARAKCATAPEIIALSRSPFDVCGLEQRPPLGGSLQLAERLRELLFPGLVALAPDGIFTSGSVGMGPTLQAIQPLTGTGPTEFGGAANEPENPW